MHDSQTESIPARSSEVDLEVARVLDAYLAEVEAGRLADPRSVLAANPEIAEKLKACLDVLQFAGQMGADQVPGDGSGTIGDYVLLGEIARGGMGVVYKARQCRLQRIVALKMIAAGQHAGPEQRARFLIEAEAVARLRHPNIVQIHDFGEADGHPFVTLELLEGGSLADRLEGTTQPGRAAAELMETLARAVHAAHQAGIVHRDIKPSNVLFDRDGVPKIADFGLAKRLEVDVGHTLSGQVIGTPSYMAPEQAQGHVHQIGPAADIYALGATLYEMLTGRPPFKAPSTMETLHQVIHEDVMPPSRIQARVPRDLETICLKCLQKEPSKRYASALELAGDLRRYLEDRPIQARRTGAWERTAKWTRRRPAVAGLLLVCAVTSAVLLAGGAWFVWQLHRANRLTQQSNHRLQIALADVLRQRDLVRRNLYVADMNLARRAWDESNAGRVLEILGKYRTADSSAVDLRDFEWYYLKRLCDSGAMILRGHTTPVLGVAFSPDGTRLVSAGGQVAGGKPHRSGELKVWDLASGREVVATHAQIGALMRAVFSPDGTRIASAGADGTVRVWNAANGREFLELRGHDRWVSSVAFSPDGTRLASAGEDATVRVWDAANGRELLRLTGHRDAALGLAFSPDGTRIASTGASDDGTVRIWDLAAGRLARTLTGHSAGVNAVAFSPDGTRLASASDDQTVRLWNEAGREVLSLKGHLGRVRSVGFSPDGTQLASGGEDQNVKVWKIDTGRELATLKGHRDAVVGVAFNSDGTRLASASLDGTVRVWDEARAPGPLTLRGHTNRVNAVAFSPDGRQLISSGVDNKGVRVWDVATGKAIRTHPGSGMLAIHPDGRRVASAGLLSSATVWDLQTGQVAWRLWGHTAYVLCAAFSPDGTRLATAGLDRSIRVWDVRTGRPLGTLSGHESLIWKLAFSPDGTRLASASHDTQVKLWDVPAGRESRTLRGHTGRLWGVAFSPDGRRLATASEDQTAKVWNADSGREVVWMRGHTARVVAVAFSPNSARLATASMDSSVRIWDAATGQELLALKGHNREVSSLAFSPDGTRLASGGLDQAVVLWDASR